MIYTAEEQKRIEDILAGFKHLIDKSDNFDVLYSKKIGYIWIHNGYFPRATSIYGAEILLMMLLLEMSSEVQQASFECKTTEKKSAEIRRRAASIIDSMTDSKEYCLKYLEKFMENNMW